MYSEKISDLISKAEKGLTSYQIELGDSYLNGIGYDGKAFPQDFSKAKYWLEKAHERGAFTATVILGTMYENGNGVDKDTLKAIKLYEHAASQGAYLPCLYLARIYSKGIDIPLSVKKATKWYKQVLLFEGEIESEVEMGEARQFLSQ